MSRVRWGIIGAAEIARKNWKAILDSGNACVTAVASRNQARAQKFIDECQAEAPFHSAPKAFASYQELLASDLVDAVYVPLPTGRRKEVILAAAQARKHVLCEKPCARNVAELQEMLEACRRQGVQFMDGVMFVHSQRLELMGEVLRGSQGVGQIRRIDSAFSFRAPPEFFASNIRAHSDLEPDGCLGDLGWYCIRLSLWAMKWQMPAVVSGRILAQRGRPDSPTSVPAEFSGEFLFEDGTSASFFCSFLAENQQWAVISGTEGYLRAADFVLPFAGPQLSFEVLRSEYHIRGCNFTMEPRARQYTVPEYSHGHANSQESKLFRHFSEQALSGKLNNHWPETALKTQIVMSACLESARANGALVSIPPSER
jgi:predicted dehydrogenase